MTNLKEKNQLNRRQFVKLCAGASLMAWQANALSATQLLSKSSENKKIVWVVLRGALDSLHTIVPTFDPQLKKLRPTLSVSYKSDLLALDDGFSLHPALTNLHAWYKTKQLAPVVAVGSGYPARSHFDGQDYLESGKPTIDHDSGWLARAIDIKQKKALAIAHSTPISLRSSEQVSTWYPSKLKESKEDIYQQLSKLYRDDEFLSARLQEGLETKRLAEMDMGGNKKQNGKFKDLTAACAKLLTVEHGADCAMLELGGWDTHNNQEVRLNRQLTELDQGLAILKEGLGDTWQNTVVIIATEFGRTARENGTGGTDHGTGSGLFIAGGAVKGGQILGQWPGLADHQLFKKRDLMPTTNSFAWFANILEHHWGFSHSELSNVFPNIKLYSKQLV